MTERLSNAEDLVQRWIRRGERLLAVVAAAGFVVDYARDSGRCVVCDRELDACDCPASKLRAALDALDEDRRKDPT